MPWTCTICARKGDRAGTTTDKRKCYRAGVATMKGHLLCCNCMRATGWDGYEEYGCKNCHRLSAATLPDGSDQRKRVDHLVLAAFATLPAVPLVSQEHVFMPLSTRTFNLPRLAVFEFDNVLFRTPKRPSWWPFHGYHSMLESLLPPLVPLEPESDWFNQDVIKAAKEAFEDENTWSVLITFRGDAFRERVEHVLNLQGVRFNETRFRALRPYLSELGSTQLAQKGYGDLQTHFQQRPFHPQDKHLLSTVGHILSRGFSQRHGTAPDLSPYVRGAEVDLWVCGNNPREQAARLQRILRSSARRSLCVRGIVSRGLVGGRPTPEDLARMQSTGTRNTARAAGTCKVHSLSGIFLGSTRLGRRRARPCNAMTTIHESHGENPSSKFHSVQEVDRCEPGGGKQCPAVRRQTVAAFAEWPSEVYAGHGTNSGWKWGRSHVRSSKYHWHRDARLEGEEAANDSDATTAEEECDEASEEYGWGREEYGKIGGEGFEVHSRRWPRKADVGWRLKDCCPGECADMLGDGCREFKADDDTESDVGSVISFSSESYSVVSESMSSLSQWLPRQPCPENASEDVSGQQWSDEVGSVMEDFDFDDCNVDEDYCYKDDDDDVISVASSSFSEYSVVSHERACSDGLFPQPEPCSAARANTHSSEPGLDVPLALGSRSSDTERELCSSSDESQSAAAAGTRSQGADSRRQAPAAAAHARSFLEALKTPGAAAAAEVAGVAGEGRARAVRARRAPLQRAQAAATGRPLPSPGDGPDCRLNAAQRREDSGCALASGRGEDSERCEPWDQHAGGRRRGQVGAEKKALHRGQQARRCARVLRRGMEETGGLAWCAEEPPERGSFWAVGAHVERRRRRNFWRGLCADAAEDALRLRPGRVMLRAATQ